MRSGKQSDEIPDENEPATVVIEGDENARCDNEPDPSSFGRVFAPYAIWLRYVKPRSTALLTKYPLSCRLVNT